MKKNGIEVTIITPKISKTKESSFWYRDKQIAEVKTKTKSVVVEARGEIRVQFKPNDTVYKNEQAVDEAIDRNLNDKKLAKINKFDGWHNNNWFAVMEIDKNGEIGDDLAIADDYDEAIELAKDVLSE